MAMIAGGRQSGPTAVMNVTPMVDILLVLLVIFMIVPKPPSPTGMESQIPQPSSGKPQKQDDISIVVQLRAAEGSQAVLQINRESVAWRELQGKLQDIYKARANKTMFIQGDKDVEFSDVARVLDIARAADVSISVGLITKETSAD
jgi:biopolymer transport protein TolR